MWIMKSLLIILVMILIEVQIGTYGALGIPKLKLKPIIKSATGIVTDLANFTLNEILNFRSFKTLFNKVYASVELENIALLNFLVNQRDVDEHNEKFKKGVVSYQRGLCEYSDMSTEEMNERVNKFRMPDIKRIRRVKNSNKIRNEVEGGEIETLSKKDRDIGRDDEIESKGLVSNSKDLKSQETGDKKKKIYTLDQQSDYEEPQEIDEESENDSGLTEDGLWDKLAEYPDIIDYNDNVRYNNLDSGEDEEQEYSDLFEDDIQGTIQIEDDEYSDEIEPDYGAEDQNDLIDEYDQDSIIDYAMEYDQESGEVTNDSEDDIDIDDQDLSLEYIDDQIPVHTESISSKDDILNYVTKGFINPVQRQGVCGSCWSFSATAAIEAAWFLKTGKLIKLSEQQLIDCNRNDYNNGCDGGDMSTAFKFVEENGGITLESKYPYRENDTFECKDAYSVARVLSHEIIEAGDEELLKEMLIQHGPISVAIDASLKSFQTYKNGVYYDPKCSYQVNHAMVLVGYGTVKETGEDFWILKNTYGPAWGIGGYIRLARNRESHCGITVFATYPICS